MAGMNRELFSDLESGLFLSTFEEFRQHFSPLLDDVTFHGDTPLHIAARKGYLDPVRWILAEKPSLANARNKHNNTPLHVAAKSGNPDVVEIILQQKQSSKYRYNKYKETALVIASQYGHLRVVQRLLDETSPDLFEWERSLKEAAYRGHKDVVVALLDKTPARYLNAGQFILNNLFSPFLRQRKDVISQTPILHRAVQGGDPETVRALLSHPSFGKGLTTERDEYGRCAVHIAAMKGRFKIIDIFKSVMPESLDLRSLDDKSVLHFAVEYDQFDVVHCLLSHTEPEKVADMVSRDHDSFHNTALHLAAINQADYQVIESLLSPPGLDRDALHLDVNALNDEGMTVLDIASAAARDNNNYWYITRMLAGAGGIPSSLTPKSNGPKKRIGTDTTDTHMLVASLIATVTFAAMFQIPGGIDDDKDSIHYGGAKLVFGKVFRLFLFSDTAAFIASLTVVAGLLLGQHLQDTSPLSSVIDTLTDISEASLLVSIFWTLVTFVSATITVIMPHNLDSLKGKDNMAFSQYRQLWRYEISLAAIAPVLVVVVFLIGLMKSDRLNRLISRGSILLFLLFQMLYLSTIILLFTFQ